MQKDNNRVIIIGIIVWLAVMFGLFLLINTGAYKLDPVVEIRPDNCYSETLRVVTDEDYRPYSFYGNRGEYSGHDVELIASVANKLQMNLDLWFVPWEDGIKAVTNGRADVLMTCDYADSFDGSEKLRKSEPVSDDDFIVYSRNRISSMDELYTKKIAITENANVLTQLEMLNLTKNCVAYSSNRKAMEAVAEGDADCAVMRNTVGTVLLQDRNLKGIDGYISIGKSYMCFGMRDEDGELTKRINDALEELKSSGELKRLDDKWLTTFVEPYSFSQIIAENQWIIITFGLLVAVLLAVFINDEERKRRTLTEKAFYLDVVENLTNDFESVIFVGDYVDAPDDVVELRLSDTLKRNIPDWESEHKLQNKLSLMCNTIVAPEDRERFSVMTQRRAVLRKLDTDKVYFVDFKALIDDEPHLYQIKFSAGLGSSGEVKNCIVGIHNIDEE